MVILEENCDQVGENVFFVDSVHMTCGNQGCDEDMIDFVFEFCCLSGRGIVR